MNEWNHHRKNKCKYFIYASPFFLNFYKGKRNLTPEQKKEKEIIKYAFKYKNNRQKSLKTSRKYYQENRDIILKERAKEYQENKKLNLI
ncbi:MAG: hypothetical protein ACI9YE_000472 [Psychroserpens sp.]|jgi:hypothetical protein